MLDKRFLKGLGYEMSGTGLFQSVFKAREQFRGGYMAPASYETGFDFPETRAHLSENVRAVFCRRT